VFRCVLGSEGCVLVPRSSGTPVATWAWPTWVVSRRCVLEAVFILLEFPSPSRIIFIGSHSLPPLWFAVSVHHVLLLFNRLDTICFLCPSCWMRVLRCCFGLVVLGFWILEGTLSVWSFPRVRCFKLIFLSLRALSIVSWLVLRVSCGSGIGSWAT
jgi:hypothetical protein